MNGKDLDSRDMTIIRNLQEEIAILKKDNAILEEQVRIVKEYLEKQVIAVNHLKGLRNPVESGSVSL